MREHRHAAPPDLGLEPVHGLLRPVAALDRDQPGDGRFATYSFAPEAAWKHNRRLIMLVVRLQTCSGARRGSFVFARTGAEIGCEQQFSGLTAPNHTFS